MEIPAKSVLGFGIWALFSGLGLLVMPQTLVGIVGLVLAEPVYARIIGFILIEIGILYVWLAINNITAAFTVTVYIRIIPVMMLTIFVVTGMGPWQLILFAIVDVLSAMHTWWSLKKR